MTVPSAARSPHHYIGDVTDLRDQLQQTLGEAYRIERELRAD